jgi:ribosomal-protein-alanine N-acetyltransferase
VALEEDKVVGYVGSQTVIDESDMMNIAVHPDFRRRGIAEALVAELEAALRQRGSHALTLEVRDSNAPAIALYEKLGFAQVGLRKNYYRNPKEDARILRKEWES